MSLLLLLAVAAVVEVVVEAAKLSSSADLSFGRPLEQHHNGLPPLHAVINSR
jgi:hypothetical protein